MLRGKFNDCRQTELCEITSMEKPQVIVDANIRKLESETEVNIVKRILVQLS